MDVSPAAGDWRSYAVVMSSTFTPADMPQRRPADIGRITESHETRIRAFAFFAYRGGRDEQLAPAELGQRAWRDALAALADLAEPEDWTGPVPSDRPFPILDSFLRYTHQRLVMEDKIAVSGNSEYAALNTGLLTPYAEEVFGLFRRNTHEGGQPWFFLRWATESDRDLLREFDEPPQMAEYVSSASDLVYDWRRELKLAYGHILGDNIDRFPPDLAAQPRRAKQALDSAINWALRKARRNYKVIVPQWYPPLGESGAQFLMPLDLTGDGAADLALVVSAIGDQAYRGNTVLTLAMAYTNARLVARPDSDWLLPTAAPARTDEEMFRDLS